MKSNEETRERTRSTIGRIGAHSLHAKYDSMQVTAPARFAFEQRWERMVDPEGVLALDELARRAKHAKKAYFIELGRRSGQARRKAA